MSETTPPYGDDDATFFRAVLSLKTVDECQRFFADVATPGELKALSERFHVARLLDAGELSYREIHDVTGVSTTTITPRGSVFEPGAESRLPPGARSAPPVQAEPLT